MLTIVRIREREDGGKWEVLLLKEVGGRLASKISGRWDWWEVGLKNRWEVGPKTSGRWEVGPKTSGRWEAGPKTSGRLARKLVGDGRMARKLVGDGRLARKLVGGGRLARKLVGDGRLAPKLVGDGMLAPKLVGDGRLAPKLVGDGRLVPKKLRPTKNFAIPTGNVARQIVRRNMQTHTLVYWKVHSWRVFKGIVWLFLTLPHPLSANTI